VRILVGFINIPLARISLSRSPETRSTRNVAIAKNAIAKKKSGFSKETRFLDCQHD
jgi:hypothetical protein